MARGAGDTKKRRSSASRRNSGEPSRKNSGGNKIRHQPGDITYNPDAVFELNKEHLYFLFTVSLLCRAQAFWISFLDVADL